MAKENLPRWAPLVDLLAQWFGLGKLPKSPGTFGTLGAIPLYFVFFKCGPLPYMILALMFIVFAIFISQLYENIHVSHDPSEIVIDEVAGFLVAMVWLPLSWRSVALGFLLFRFFDILKPFPISYLDRKVQGGFGTVIDDLAAGLAVNIILQFWYGRFDWTTFLPA